MLDAQLPIHSFTGVTALGVLPSGRPVWPVIGGSDGDGDGGDGDGGDGGGADGADGDGQDGDGLGDAGKKALSEERRARREAERARRAAEQELASLREQMSQQGSGGSGDGGSANPGAEQIRREAEQAAVARANERILRAEIRAEAAGKLADPADALAHLDLSRLEVGDDGAVDKEEIADAISDLITRKPYLAAKASGFQGTGDGGSRGAGSGPKQVTESQFRAMTPEQKVQAREEGRLTALLGG